MTGRVALLQAAALRRAQHRPERVALEDRPSEIGIALLQAAALRRAEHRLERVALEDRPSEIGIALL